MSFRVLATDYDGTIATHGNLDDASLQAIRKLRATGHTIIMVTGREIEDLRTVFHHFDEFDLLVAENGALLYWPSTGKEVLLAEPPPAAFGEALRQRGATPLSIGRIVVATFEPYETDCLQLIRDMHLELEIIFNKGSVMVLPTGINKATGLTAALKELNLSAEQVVGVGDAENDHAFLKMCGFSCAVANALPNLKTQVDLVTPSTHGQGVLELVDLWLAGQLTPRPRPT